MNLNHESELTFLQDATPGQLEEAVALNHREWMILKARAASGEVHEADGVTWTYAGPQGEAMILFPRLAAAKAGEQLDAIADYYRERRPEPLVGCWSLDPPQPPDLDVRLLARGFQPGWQPRWMALDLQRMNTDHPRPDGMEVRLVEEEAIWDVRHLPYYSRDTAALRHAATRLRPQRVWHFAAWLHGQPVGHSTLCLTTGPLGVAGLYDIGVVPEARKKGIGKAVTLAACRHAQRLGCRHALLNATGERMYQQIGFNGIGYGQTWWLNAPRLASQPPSKEQVALAEAVGRGDLEALSALGQPLSSEALNAPLTNGMTLMQLAVHTGQTAAADWLAARGATRDEPSA
jgi:GNAT superfamily N-acetyltransferase